MTDRRKRKVSFHSDMNNNEVTKARKNQLVMMINDTESLFTVGQIKALHMLNFMCHKNFAIEFYPTHMQIVTGANGSGKSTIANAICLCLGAQAKTTGRTSNVQSFIRNGETSAQVSITLANDGPEAYKPELYGKEIQIIRKIGSRQSSYTILGANRRIISKRKETIDEIIQALSISPENPLCVLHQEIAKTFLINSDARKKYQFYMKVSQLDQIKQAYEQSICTVQLLTQRVNAMKQKHVVMLRDLEPLEQEVKKIELRRDYEGRRHGLEKELRTARADQLRQKLIEVHNELDQIEINQNELEQQIVQENKELVKVNQRLTDYLMDRDDLEKDMNSLRELIAHFSKQKHDMQYGIHSFTQDCEEYRRILTEVGFRQIYLQKQIDTYENLNQQVDTSDQQRSQIDHDISSRQEKQIEWNNIITSLTEDLHLSENTIRDKQSTIDFLDHELQQQQHELNELINIDQDKTNAYGSWMLDCLEDIQNDQRFDRKPIGPIGRYIHCTDPHWAYAVEKHLASIMPAFICANNHDEQILLEILSKYSSNDRPPIYVRAFSDNVHDISGTLKHIKQAKLISIYDVVKIDDITVECTLIDLKHIEATILFENVEDVKRIRASRILEWQKIDRKIKQVVEAWTHDGSNIKLNKTFRIYTNEKQAIKYFPTNSIQSLSMEELQVTIEQLQEQLKQMNESMSELKTSRQTASDKLNQALDAITDNQEKINELMKDRDRLHSAMPILLDCSLDELKEKARKYDVTYTDTIHKYDESKEKKDENLQYLVDIEESYENLTKKLDLKTQESDLIIEKLQTEQFESYEIQRKIKKLTKKSVQLQKNILKLEIKRKQLTKKQSKKSRKTNHTTRSVCDIQQELRAIIKYLKTNEDTNEERREVIHTYRLRRDAAKEYKQIYERCYEQIEYLKEFINKRQEGFLAIADRHQYFLRNKFQKLMEKYHFDDSDIKIDHKKEELEIIVRKHQRSLASLSGGERSISTFCFLLALWQCIYQPFRLLDEIDIYMDNENLNASLDILYENTRQYSSSQHIILTPQAIDSQAWNKFDVPVFNMPTPKRSAK